MGYHITTEIFAIPHGQDFIIYVPLKRIALLVNEDAAHLLSLMRKTEIDALPIKHNDFITTLQNLGIFDNVLDMQLNTKIERIFQPTQVTLFPTYDCNLHCTYCYSLGGEQSLSMTWPIARAALDFVCSNALSKEKPSFEVCFHGGGEPTKNWSLLVNSVEYAQKLANENGLTVFFSMVSNCILSEKQREWIVANVNSFTVSLDGPPEIQNTQRPLANGQESYNIVAASLEYFDKMGFCYGIRSTISEASVQRMSEIASHFCEHFNTRDLHFEPLFECGRCATTKETAPDWRIFAAAFREAKRTAEQYQTRLYFSGACLDRLNSTFCGAAGNNFVILPTGQVTSCYEICRPTDPQAALFFYGTYDAEQNAFLFDEQRREYLFTRQVQNMVFCTNCFMKWHCAGDCLAKAAIQSGDIFHPVSNRCRLIQEIGKDELIALVLNSTEKPGSKLHVEILPC